MQHLQRYLFFYLTLSDNDDVALKYLCDMFNLGKSYFIIYLLREFFV